MKAVGAENNHRLGLGELTHPIIQTLRIVPNRPDHDVLTPGEVVRRASVDDLHRRSRVEHRLHLLDSDRGQFAILFLLEWPRRRNLDRVFVTSLHRVPVDVAHERIDISRGIGTEVEVISVLVHVERKDRYAAGERLGVVAGILVDQASVARYMNEQDPAGAASQRVSHGDELAAPALDRPEITGKRRRKQFSRLPSVSAQACEVELVQEGRIERDQLLALERVDNVTWCAAEIERLELFGDRVQAIERAAVVVFIMALDETRRDAVQQPGPAKDWTKTIAHGGFSKTEMAGAYAPPRCGRRESDAAESSFIGARARRVRLQELDGAPSWRELIPGVLRSPCMGSYDALRRFATPRLTRVAILRLHRRAPHRPE